MVTLADYVGRITPWQSGHPKFTATVSGTLDPVVAAKVVVAAIPGAYDLDTAVGTQLDVDGEWIGPSRRVPVPIPNAWFAWATPGRGWGQGVWKQPSSQRFAISLLDDETYRRLLKAVVLANRWDGTVPGAQEVLDAFFVDPETYVFIQDKGQVPFPRTTFAWATPGRGWGQGSWRADGIRKPNIGTVNVAMSICVAGKIPPPILLGLLGQNALRLKPAGVDLAYRITSVDRKPIFGFGVQNKYISGWGKGAWAVSPEYLLNKA
ncbi:hypothetical protein HNR01_001794 [Methylorubrum rhodesianum]|uniref:DUF2612 domain-containing protein n=1 Tax=Methylorubrum rhodesianum TaxID=29427 RepID=UPI00160FAD32|nr:DUF2612 domain-containing protein [Methylorubrum rhodesianum]MBB5762174.1 hypothetical protein [Methylorubrum rhodesianum]